MVNVCHLIDLVQLRRNGTVTRELVVTPHPQFCLKLIDLPRQEVRPYSKYYSDQVPAALLPVLKYEPILTDLLNATFAGPRGER